ncbi:T-cell-specific surface glycoprotein CD28-like [Bufo gargarizans]|uniref:T-cell-specific surface glycoprotein CD28-like n=1 Tax=Bufo gargarizans TaxID=30331 RepID=UPI001CF517D8|nr:T-cell-specific surface glycoprotein CD28-like [Bufo gargarizans]
MLTKIVFVMNACLGGLFLLTTLQVSGQRTESGNSFPHLVVASHMGEAELCRYSLSGTSGTFRDKFNLTLEKDGNVVCLVYNSGTKLKLHNWTNGTQCHISPFNGSFSVSLTNLAKMHTGNYICHIQTLVPPPVTHSTVNRTLLYVHDVGVQPPVCHILSFVEIWVLTGVSIFLLACFMVVLIISAKRKNCRECDARNMELTKDHNSEYMHMASVPHARWPLRQKSSILS